MGSGFPGPDNFFCAWRGLAGGTEDLAIWEAGCLVLIEGAGGFGGGGLEGVGLVEGLGGLDGAVLAGDVGGFEGLLLGAAAGEEGACLVVGYRKQQHKQSNTNKATQTKQHKQSNTNKATQTKQRKQSNTNKTTQTIFRLM